VFDRVRPYLLTGLFSALIAYFLFQAMTGDRGLLLEDARRQTLKSRSAELARLISERKDLEARVSLLRDDHLSKDLLEERARVLLGFADPRDYVIRVEPSARVSS
jgi:cell division protein FtsB